MDAMHAALILAGALVPFLDSEPVPFVIQVAGATPVTGVLHAAPRTPDAPPDDLATVVVVPDAGDLHARLDALIGPTHGRRMNLVLLDATRRDLTPLLAWLAARELDVSRLGLVGFGEGAEAVVATQRARPDVVRAAMLVSPDPARLEAADWLETPLFLYEAGPQAEAFEGLVEALVPHGRFGHRLPPSGPHGCAFLDMRGHPALIANWMRDLLVRSPYLTVPSYAEGDERVGQPPAHRHLRSVVRERAGSSFELRTGCVGEAWTLAAVVEGPFAGAVLFEVEGHELRLALEPGGTPTEASSSLAVTRNGQPSDLVGHLSVLGDRTSITLTLPRPLEGAQLALRYLPAQGSPLDLPGGGAPFQVHLFER
jgi:hypothetical protein